MIPSLAPTAHPPREHHCEPWCDELRVTGHDPDHDRCERHIGHTIITRPSSGVSYELTVSRTPDTVLVSLVPRCPEPSPQITAELSPDSADALIATLARATNLT